MATGRADEDFLTNKEIGALLGFTERYASHWVKVNGLPTVGHHPARVAAALVRAKALEQKRKLYEPAERRAPRPDSGETSAAPEPRDNPSAPIEAACRTEGAAHAGTALAPHAAPLAESRGPVERPIEVTRRTEDLAIEVGTLREQLLMHEAALRKYEAAIGKYAATTHEKNAKISRLEADNAGIIEAMHEAASTEMRKRVSG